MLVVKSSAGVTSEENPKNSVHTGDEVCKQGIHSGFETQDRYHQKSKTGVAVALQKDLCQPIFFLKNQNCLLVSVTILGLILCRKVDFTESLLSSFDIGSRNLLFFCLQSYNLAVGVLLNGTK